MSFSNKRHSRCSQLVRWFGFAAIFLLWVGSGELAAGAFQSTPSQAQTPSHDVPIVRPKLPEAENSARPIAPAEGSASALNPELDQGPSGDWCVELVDSILSSPNPEAYNRTLDAAFAAGPDIVPKLKRALDDDRTAEFAAQALAYIGGPDAIKLLAALINDKRDLNLRRFFYGSLAEYRSPEATKALLDAIALADAEPDRTVTEAAILAFSTRTDPSVIPQLHEAESKIRDVVLHDDLDNVVEVIQKRAHDLGTAAHATREAGAGAGAITGPPGTPRDPDSLSAGSLFAAVRLYFLPALGPAPKDTVAEPNGNKLAGAQSAGANTFATREHSGATAHKSAGQTGPSKQVASSPEESRIKVNILSLVSSPDKTRALAHVAFENPQATAYYDMVLSKRFGEWTLGSVWLGPEVQNSVTPKNASPARSTATDTNH